MFLIALTIYFVYTSNISQDDEDLLNNLISESKLVSSSLISGGYPESWDNSSVERIGLTNNDQRLDIDKLSNLNSINYNQTKGLLGTMYDYLIFFQYKNESIININGFCAKGKPGTYTIEDGICMINTSSIDASSLVKSERFIIYEKENLSDIVKMVVYLWD